MRRSLLILPAVLAAAVLAGCGFQGTVAPTAERVVGTIPKAEPPPATPALDLQSKADPQAGAKIFQQQGCANCHTLAAANASGTVGPNLDQAKPDYRLATARVTLGKGAMPSFKDQLSTQQIADVAAYVVQATHQGQ